MSSLFFLLIAGHCYFGPLHHNKTKAWPAEKLHYVCILNQHLDPFCSVWTLPTCWWPEVWREINPQQLHSHRPGREAEGSPLPPAQTPAGVCQRRLERSARLGPGRSRGCRAGDGAAPAGSRVGPRLFLGRFPLKVLWRTRGFTEQLGTPCESDDRGGDHAETN